MKVVTNRKCAKGGTFNKHLKFMDTLDCFQDLVKEHVECLIHVLTSLC